MIHTSIDTLFIWNFQKIRETGDLKYLIEDYAYDFEFKAEQVHKDIWDNINRQYLDATAHRFESRKFSDTKRVVLSLKMKYNNIAQCCFILANEWREDVVLILKGLGYTVKSKEDLPKVMTAIKNIKTQVREKEMEMQGDFGKTEPISFESIVDKISDHKKRDIDPRTKTVREWIAIEDNYLKDMKNASDKQKGHTK